MIVNGTSTVYTGLKFWNVNGFFTEKFGLAASWSELLIVP